MSLIQLRKHLRTKKHKELIDEIADLYKKFSNVREYYQASVLLDEENVLARYKKIVNDEFFPSRSLNAPMRLSVARQAVRDFKKIASTPSFVADLMLFYVETCLQFTNEYGDMYESFYNSIESMFAESLKFITQNDLQNEFRQRAWEICSSADGIGWGMDYLLPDLYFEYQLDPDQD